MAITRQRVLDLIKDFPEEFRKTILSIVPKKRQHLLLFIFYKLNYNYPELLQDIVFEYLQNSDIDLEEYFKHTKAETYNKNKIEPSINTYKNTVVEKQNTLTTPTPANLSTFFDLNNQDNNDSATHYFEQKRTETKPQELNKENFNEQTANKQDSNLEISATVVEVNKQIFDVETDKEEMEDDEYDDGLDFIEDFQQDLNLDEIDSAVERELEQELKEAEIKDKVEINEKIDNNILLNTNENNDNDWLDEHITPLKDTKNSFIKKRL
jgi:hypothetical protein